ncbi:MAG: 2-dehydro-3-deoxyphosphooctonate aldolase [Epsilonproteobacteria bacterium]|nr:MAG: 2-dehydro-3-deoxyphosphooctonate aldolase [Campylobacterota bacterium]
MNKIKSLISTIICILILAQFVEAANTSPESRLSKNVTNKILPKISKELKKKGLKLGEKIYIRIFKEESLLELWIKNINEYRLFKSYKICNYSGKLGPKTKKGDMQSPEGFYFVKSNNLNPYSSYHLSFNIGYPNRYEREKGYTGSALMIHGECVSIGCYAMTNPFIEEIYTLVQTALQYGQPYFRVHIFPFRMTRENMKKYENSDWIEFWKNLKEGHDKFIEYGNIPPNVEIQNSKYIFNKSKF